VRLSHPDPPEAKLTALIMYWEVRLGSKYADNVSFSPNAAAVHVTAKIFRMKNQYSYIIHMGIMNLLIKSVVILPLENLPVGL